MTESSRRWALLFAAVLLLAGCGGVLGPRPTPAPPPTGGYTAELSGEVERVDEQRNELWITRDDGRWVDIDYAAGTRVFYRGEEYPVGNLEQGDYVRVRVREDAAGDLSTDWIEVEESVQERRGEPPPTPGERREDEPGDEPSETRTERLTGYVEWIDDRSGELQLRTNQGQEVVIELPFDLSEEQRRVFRDLRRGDYVRVEVRRLQGDRVELVRFD